MPKFIKMGQYIPAEYTLGDFVRYQYAKKYQAHQESAGTSVDINFYFSTVNSYKKRLKDAELNETCIAQIDATASKFLNNLTRPIKSTRTKIFAIPQLVNGNVVAQHILEEFEETLEFIRKINSSKKNIVSDKYSPAIQSLQNLKKAWEMSVCSSSSNGRWSKAYPDFSEGSASFDTTFWDVIFYEMASEQGGGVLSSIAEAHINNITMVLNSDYDDKCRREFEEGAPPIEPKLAKNRIKEFPIKETEPHRFARFFLTLYQDPRFQHWFTQLILLAIIVTSVLIAAAFIFKFGFLSAVISGLSKWTSHMFFGAAIGVAAVASVTLAASLHARFFPPSEGGVGSHTQIGSIIEEQPMFDGRL